MLRWRLACSFAPSSDTIWSAIQHVATLVESLTDGALRIEPFPAGADALDLVARGEVACGHTAGSFYVERDPVLALATFAPFGLDARRHAAWLDGPGAGYAARAWTRQGVIALPCLNTGAQTGGWFRRPVRTLADFAGLRIRTAGLPALVFERLGACPVNPAAANILPALRAGELDAADWIGPHDDLVMGFHEAAPCYHYPGAMEPAAQLSLIVGEAAWAALADPLRSALRCAAAAAERALLIRYDTLNPPALTALLAAGVALCRFPDAVLAGMRRASTEMLDALASDDPAFAAALRSYRDFGMAGHHWWQIGERDAAAAADRLVVLGVLDQQR